MSFHIDLDRIDRRQLVPGLILIGIGILGLFGAFGWMRGMGGFVGAILFGAAAYFAYLQGRHTGRLLWNAAAFPLAGLAIASIAPEPLGGFAFLGSIGAAFALAWRDDARRWWAVIPAGTLLALAVTALVDGSTRGGAGGSVFLFGLAATFFVLTRLSVHPQPWAIFPAAVLAVLAVVTLTTSGGWLVPVLLIAAGAWMLFRPSGTRTASATSGRTTGTITTVPAGRVAPTAPAAPVGPVAPAGPVEPATADQPAAPAAPFEPAAPHPRDAATPTDPAAPERPAGEDDAPR